MDGMKHGLVGLAEKSGREIRVRTGCWSPMLLLLLAVCCCGWSSGCCRGAIIVVIDGLY